MSSSLSGILPLLLYILALAVLGVLAGVRLAERPHLSRPILAFSGGVLVGVAVFWILPEIAVHLSWAGALAGLTSGFLLVWFIDRYVHSICPSHAHDHEHDHCANTLHGFALPLVVASGIHSFFDGWSLAAAQTKGFENVKAAVVIGIGVHKLPEAVAMGVLMLAAVGSVWKATSGAILAQSMMLVGGWLATELASRLGTSWTSVFLAVAAGVFVYLGYHAIESECRRRGFTPGLMPALTGAVGAAALKSLLPGM